MSTTRRRFIRTALATSAVGLCARRSDSIEPIKRDGKPHFRLSLAAYSYRKFLNLRQKPKPPMTLADFIDEAALMPLDAVELTAYYFPETSPEYLAGLKARCTRLGLDVSGTAVGNNFCTGKADELKKQIASVKQWIEHTSRLGGKAMRIFAGRVDRGDTEQRAITRAIAAIEECCSHARNFGVYLALENHGGVTSTADQILAIVKGVKSDLFGVNLDTGNFHTEDPYGDLARLAPYAVNVQVKTEISAAGKKPEEADLKRFVDMLKKVKYRGYVALEYEASADPKKAVPHYLAELRKLIA